MAGGASEGRSLEDTPTWAVAFVCFVLVLISIIIEHILHLIGKWLVKRNKRALCEALEKIKSVGQGPISNICISKAIGNTWHPCNKKQETELLHHKDEHKNSDHENGGHRRLLLVSDPGDTKMRRWKAWERETRTPDYQFSNDPERFRFARETSFGRRHLNFWSQSPILLWTAHLAPQSQTRFDFQNYINRSLEEDFNVVVGIRLAFLSMATLCSIDCTKLQVIITKMGLRIQERGEVVRGTPLVQPGDDLFWFNWPRLILYLIHFVLFQNAFQLAFLAWTLYEFGLKSCFHEKVEDIVIRISMGYVTLPLYALVTQMGSKMRPAIFDHKVATALRKWHHTAKKHVKQSKHSSSTSLPGTPTQSMSPVHLLRNQQGEGEDSGETSPRMSNFKNEGWEREGSLSPPHPPSTHHGFPVQHEIDIQTREFSFDKS
ncbi:hypothetical protein FEM48_Zijuj12G0174200 [Ziziphus jujuba var. spinosa]|uniref:MLO-like protein n=1 Tax=Ziziphus jujuba var. spinosa TaxID=714518 RepID=A0A978UEN4_ZIZJJ|nr:hypothetical protein FEM48_Zijuj12G0174200 [Ziziphus jujuba var. spinosa]